MSKDSNGTQSTEDSVSAGRTEEAASNPPVVKENQELGDRSATAMAPDGATEEIRKRNEGPAHGSSIDSLANASSEVRPGEQAPAGLRPGKRTAKAVKKLHRAQAWRRSGGYTGEVVANILEKEAQELLRPTAPIKVSAGEAVPDPTGQDERSPTFYIRDTLENPDVMAGEASECRTELAARAGVLELSLDLAQSIGARNSLERMLAHQLATAHRSVMLLSERALDPKNQPAETARLTTAAARMMGCFLAGCQAIERIHRGGHRSLAAEVVAIAQGGDVIAAAKVGPGSESGHAGPKRSNGNDHHE